MEKPSVFTQSYVQQASRTFVIGITTSDLLTESRIIE